VRKKSELRNPATTSYAWVGSENAGVIFLNDFRWSPEILAWKNMLLLLEGQTLHLPAPKTHFSKDIVFERDTPIFATSKGRLFSWAKAVALTRRKPK
jgi:hypothetical protein